MSFEGMDVEQVQGLARQLDANARALDGIAGLLAVLADELGRQWQGPASARFQHEWAGRHRQALHAAAQALTEMHACLVANMNQQQRASAADAGLGATVLRDAPGVLETGLKVAGLVGIPVTMLEEIAGKHADRLPKGFNVWSDLRTVGKDYSFSDYKHSPVLKWLHDTPEVQQADKLLYDSHAYKVFDKLGGLGIAAGAVKTLGDLGKAGDAALHGHYANAAGDLVDGVSDGLKSSPNLVLYGVGVDLTLAKEVAGLDWKDTPSPFSGDNFKQYYVPELEQMWHGAFWRQAGGVLWNAM